MKSQEQHRKEVHEIVKDTGCPMTGAEEAASAWRFRNLIDLDKFGHMLEKYNKGTFTFSEKEKKETFDEITDILLDCIRVRVEPVEEQE